MVTRSRLKRVGKRKVPKWLSYVVSTTIREEVDAGRPIKQAIAIGYSRTRKAYPNYAKVLER